MPRARKLALTLRIAAPFVQPVLAGFVALGMLASMSNAMAQAVQRTDPKPAAFAPAPPLVLNDLDGKRVSLKDFRGKVVVVNFWATWCAPCVEEMPSLQLLRERHAAAGLEVLAVNAQENAARIRPFLERYGLDLPVVRDHDGSARAAWKVNVFPSTFVVTRDGRIAFSHSGEIDWSDARMRARLEPLLAR